MKEGIEELEMKPYVFYSRIIILILTVILLSRERILPSQDAHAGGTETQDIVGGASSALFNTPPANPPVIRRRRRPPDNAPNNKPGPLVGNSATNTTDSQQKEDMIEDAIALGNSARDANPPRYQDADRAYKLAAKLEPKDPRPYIGLGNILYDQKKHAEAAEAYLKALHLGNPKAVSRAGKIPTGIRFSVAPPRPYQVFINSNQGGELHAYVGTALLQKGELANAESEFRQAITQENEKAQTYASLGVTYNKHAQWYALWGYSLLRQKKYEDAYAPLRTAIQLDPNNTEYKELLEQSLSKQKQRQ